MKVITVLVTLTLCVVLSSCNGSNPPKTKASDISSAVQMSEFERELRLEREKALASEMSDYGLSYFNPEDRIQFKKFKRKKGLMMLRKRMLEAQRENERLNILRNTKR